MNLIKTIPFEFNHIQYEIRVYETGTGYLVRAYQGESYANCFIYVVEYSMNYDFMNKYGKDAYEQLIEIAQKDITNS